MRIGRAITLRKLGSASLYKDIWPCTSSSHYSTAATSEPSPAEAKTQALSARWLSDVKKRIGHCITFGLKPHQTREAGEILKEIATDWRALTIGSEGWLTGKDRRGIFRLPVVWGDQDVMGHVNNVVYNKYAESGRIEWAAKYASHIDPHHADAWRQLCMPVAEGLILRKITTEFKFPMTYPDHVSIYHKLGTRPTEGSDTFDLHVVILSERHQRPAAKVFEDCVLFDYRVGKRTPIQSFMLEVLQQTWALQEEAKGVNSQRVVGILDRVRRLELESWDQEDAVEDMGSAAN